MVAPCGISPVRSNRFSIVFIVCFSSACLIDLYHFYVEIDYVLVSHNAFNWLSFKCAVVLLFGIVLLAFLSCFNSTFTFHVEDLVYHEFCCADFRFRPPNAEVILRPFVVCFH